MEDVAHTVCPFLEGFYRSLLNVINLCVAESYINVTTTAFNVQKFPLLNSENVAVKRGNRNVHEHFSVNTSSCSVMNVAADRHTIRSLMLFHFIAQFKFFQVKLM